MINRDEAYFKSVYGKQYKELEDRIEEAILITAQRGEFKCSLDLPNGWDCKMRNKIKDQMEKLGYKVSITDYAKQYKDAPLDQRPWYDVITIDWGASE